jgi:8-oxo-dGTP pyrophosphatase MutT (NUDIX family)
MRQRATAVIVREGKLLLVRDRVKERFSLPGGGIKEGEPTISAIARELFEELGLSATLVTRMRIWDCQGSTNEHKVCLVEARGEPCLRGYELDKFIWWDMKESVPVDDHVKYISGKMIEGSNKVKNAL